MINAYALKPNNFLWLHGLDNSSGLKDEFTEERIDRLRIQVKSGDFFVTLATQLDALSEALESTDDAAAEKLQNIVTDLLHLQAYYSIIEKNQQK